MTKDFHREQSEGLALLYSEAKDPARCIIAHEDYVEIRYNGKVRQVRYDISDENWRAQTGWR